MWALIVAIPIAISVVSGILIGRCVRSMQVPSVLEGSPRCCYRCGEVKGDAEYMGLHYCQMCRIVVSSVYGG
ncbi:MAG: hypothetical protein ACREDF_11065, partial [Thermoplasmata archaeon]